MCLLSYGSKLAKEVRLVVRISGDNVSLKGLRRALYNFLFARANNGKFILQLALNRHGRQPRAKKIEALLDRSKCALRPRSESKIMARDGVPHTVRLKIAAGTFQYRDILEGMLPRPVPAMDQVLLRPNSMPTSFFANIVDNHTLCASHYVASTSRDFLQLPVYEALQWPTPVFISIGNLILRNGPRFSLPNNSRSYARAYSSVPELSVLNFLLSGRGLKKFDNASSRVYNIDEMIANFDISTITSKNLLLNTYKLMKPEKQELAQEEQRVIDEQQLLQMFDMMDDNLLSDITPLSDSFPKGS
ncbi:unnamed protein product [Gongylonema pulchrum]|uniref:tRNA-synt_1c domain-containing protein n=1 Tax=Gongylonema pulchrum TaxID=637853 RepID=A0A183E3F1_9BILA|nr:unnamed protein product [Gongylonema pulchrum]